MIADRQVEPLKRRPTDSAVEATRAGEEAKEIR